MRKSQDLLRSLRVGLGGIWDSNTSNNWFSPRKANMQSFHLDFGSRDRLEGNSAPFVSERSGHLPRICNKA